MKISELLTNADEDQITDLWNVFIEKARDLIASHNYLHSLTFDYQLPIPPDFVTLDSLKAVILACREYEIAEKAHKDEYKKAEATFNKKLESIFASVLVFEEYVVVDEYAVFFQSDTRKYDFYGHEIGEKFRVTIKLLDDVKAEYAMVDES